MKYTVVYSLMKPPIMINVQSVRVKKLALFLTCSRSSGVSCFSGELSISPRVARASFTDDAATGGKLARTGDFASTDADAGIGGGGLECADGECSRGTEGACDVNPFAFGRECAAPFTSFGSTGSSSAGDTSSASTTTGDTETGGVSPADNPADGSVTGFGSAGCEAVPAAAFCAFAAARAAFSSRRFSARANAFCFFTALLDGFPVDSDALREWHVSTPQKNASGASYLSGCDAGVSSRISTSDSSPDSTPRASQAVL